MANTKPPIVPGAPPPVPSDDQLKKLLKACERKDFRARRDTAIVRLLLDCGLRREECANLTLDDIDLDANTARVVGKGRRPRVVAFGRKTALALDRYLRVRAGHRDAARPNLWLGHNGPITPNGVYQVVRDRAREAGIGQFYTHLLRHQFAHSWLAAGGQEGDLIRLAGWKSRTMLGRYGTSAADERTREAQRKLSPGDHDAQHRAGMTESVSSVNSYTELSPSGSGIRGGPRPSQGLVQPVAEQVLHRQVVQAAGAKGLVLGPQPLGHLRDQALGQHPAAGGVGEGGLDVAGGQPMRIHLRHQPLQHLGPAPQEHQQRRTEALRTAPHLRR